MGFFVEDSGVILTQAALILAVLRWVLTWLLRFRNRDDSNKSQDHRPLASSQMIRESLTLSTFGDIMERAPLISDTCAVCLAKLSEQDEVRELRNCCHVFHKECIDRWLDYDHDHDDHENHKTCPLCRTPLLTSSQIVGWARSEPSWAVERLLYLFADDLLV